MQFVQKQINNRIFIINLWEIICQNMILFLGVFFFHSAFAVISNEYDLKLTSSALANTLTTMPISAAQPQNDQECINSNCFQGINNGKIEMNKYTPPKLIMTDEQKIAITKAMLPYSGVKFKFMNAATTRDSNDYAGKLYYALLDAGMVCKQPTREMGGFPPPGVSVMIGSDKKKAMTALDKALEDNGLAKELITVKVNDDDPESFIITVAALE